MQGDDSVPVIVGVGEITDRPHRLDVASEPLALMEVALRLADADTTAHASLLGAIDGLEIINEISWPYHDPCAQLATRLGLGHAESTYHPIGGQTPMLAIHRAALAIQTGRWRVAAICGAEAQASVSAALKTGVELGWTPRVAGFTPRRGAAYQRPIARALDFATPAHVYPFYEMATRVAWGQSFDEAQAESAMIWASNARVAQARAASWIRRDVTPAEIAIPGPDNRLIAWPYTKLMMANPGVNQGAAVLMCSLGLARNLGIAEARIVHVRGGAAADEPRDYLARETYARSPAMEWVLGEAQAIVDHAQFQHVELYSCFPCVPKMARRTLGIAADAPLSVAGGLTFFGAPLNNYMTHAAVAMVERLRAGRAGDTGLLYGQGEYVTKHHALVLARARGREPLPEDYRRDDEAETGPPEADGYVGPATLETGTVLYDRDGSVRHGGAIVRTPDGARVLARVPADDPATIARLTARAASIVGLAGMVTVAADSLPEWRAA